MGFQWFLSVLAPDIWIAESFDNTLNETGGLMYVLSFHPLRYPPLQRLFILDDILLLEKFPAALLEERNRRESGQRWVLAFRGHRLVKRCTVPRFECEVVRDGGNARSEERDRVKKSNVVAGFVTHQTIDWIGIGIDYVCEFAEVGIAVFVLDKGVSVSVRYLYGFQPLKELD